MYGTNPSLMRSLSNGFLMVYVQSVRDRPYPDEDRVKGDPARDLATVHHICETHLPELIDISKTMASIKVAIISQGCTSKVSSLLRMVFFGN